VTKQEFLDWRRSEATLIIFDELEKRIFGMQQELGANAGIEPLQDRVKVGAIMALQDVLSISAEDVTEDANDD
jgi:hypothetical protein